LRRILAAALISAGFAHYPPKWWHCSYGEQQRAACYGRPHALYGKSD
jgi:D-alanyl-D-alanine dipeptidase